MYTLYEGDGPQKELLGTFDSLLEAQQRCEELAAEAGRVLTGDWGSWGDPATIWWATYGVSGAMPHEGDVYYTASLEGVQ